jgi:hypothetical protein
VIANFILGRDIIDVAETKSVSARALKHALEVSALPGSTPVGITCASVTISEAGYNVLSRQRENLDSKLIAFSMLALCKTLLEQQTIGKLNANFCLGGCPIH